MCSILYILTEQDLFNSFVKLIEQHNPEILLGWKVEALSWSYVFQRACHLGFGNFLLKISKVPHMQTSTKSDAHTFDKDDVGEIKVLGRNILDVWRIMRHEAGELCVFSIFLRRIYSNGGKKKIPSQFFFQHCWRIFLRTWCIMFCMREFHAFSSRRCPLGGSTKVC